MIYPTIKATVRHGQIHFLEDVTLPEDAALLITVLEQDAFEPLTMGKHLIVGVEDVLSGQVTETTTTTELSRHLDTIFNEA